MNERIVVSVKAALVLMLSASAGAQWVNVPGRNIPRGKDGNPNLSAPAPRTPDGKPDLSGVWETDPKGFSKDLADYLKPGELPIRPWAKTLTEERVATQGAGIPTTRCLPPGIPLLTTSAIANPLKIVQGRDLVVILYEYFAEFRQIFLDGRALAKDPTPTWLGYSAGRWDGDALVVDTTGFNGRTWLDAVGHPATDSLHITERFERRDLGHLEVQLTIDDPQAYTKPWTVTYKMHLLPAEEVMEFICNENEKDLEHLH